METEVTRTPEYYEQKARLFEIMKLSYVIFRIDIKGETLSRKQYQKRASRMFKGLRERISTLISKWEALTTELYGVPYNLEGLQGAAVVEGRTMYQMSKPKERQALKEVCQQRLTEILPKPKRKRITAIKVTR